MTTSHETDSERRVEWRQRVAGMMFRAIGPLMRRLLRTDLPAGPNVLLTVHGRRSGRPRTTPLAIVELDGRRFIQASFGEVDWVRNLRASGRAIVTRGATSETVRATELPPETAGPMMQRALVDYHRSRLLRALLGPVVRPPIGVLRRFRFRIDETAEEYLAEARRHPLFELRPADQQIGETRR